MEMKKDLTPEEKKLLKGIEDAKISLLAKIQASIEQLIQEPIDLVEKMLYIEAQVQKAIDVERSRSPELSEISRLLIQARDLVQKIS